MQSWFARLDAVPRPVLWGWIEDLHEQSRPASEGQRTEPYGLRQAMEALPALLASDARPTRELTQPPAWLARVVRASMHSHSTTWSQGGGFAKLRALERLGVAVEVDDTYVLAMIGSLGARHDRAERDDALREDAELRERFWRVFDVEGGGEISLANIDKFSDEAATWKATVIALAADGVLDRDRLLTSCLEALRRDFSAYRAAWFSRCFRLLKPTTDELAARQPLLRDLMRSPIAATVSFAVEQLTRISRDRPLDEDLTALRPGLRARTKSAAVGSIGLLRAAAEREGRVVDIAAPMLVDALEHIEPDVQAAAADLLEHWNHTDLIRTFAGPLPASIRSRYSIPHARQDGPEPQADVEWTRRHTLADGHVVEQLAVLLEDDREPVLLEQVLARLARRPDRYSLDALAKRARQIQAADDRGEALRTHVARLVLARTGGASAGRVPASPPGRSRALARRLDEVKRILSGAAPPRALLAEPTDDLGWIDPTVFVERLDPGAAIDADLIAALVRLAPDGREAALRRLRGSGETFDAIRYALGADPGLARVQHEELWAAAAHARSPREPHPLLQRAGMDLAGRGRPIRSHFTMTSRRYSGPYQGLRAVSEAKTWTFVHWSHHVGLERPVTDSTAEWMTDGVEVDQRAGRFPHGLGGWLDWMCFATPADLEPVLTEQIDVLFIDDLHDGPRLLRGVLHHPGTLGALSAIALAQGISSSLTEWQASSDDAVISHVARGTLTAGALAEAITVLLPSRPIPRWVRAVRALAPTTAPDFLIDLLDIVLSRADLSLRGIGGLISCYRELLLEHRRRPSETALLRLASLNGTSHAAREARATVHEHAR